MRATVAERLTICSLRWLFIDVRLAVLVQVAIHGLNCITDCIRNKPSPAETVFSCRKFNMWHSKIQTAFAWEHAEMQHYSAPNTLTSHFLSIPHSTNLPTACMHAFISMVELLTNALRKNGAGSGEAHLSISGIVNSHIARVQALFFCWGQLLRILDQSYTPITLGLASRLGLNSAEPHAPGRYVANSC